MSNQPGDSASRSRWMWSVVCLLVLGTYLWLSQSGPSEMLNPDPADAPYNLLVQGFRAGQLSLKRDAPPGLTQLADPYDPAANASYRSGQHRLLDLSYYDGRLYLYFGVTPALILFWPFVTLTGHYLSQREAVAVFCSVGFLVNVALLRSLWHRYFTDVSEWMMGAGALALGLATGVPVLLSRADVYEVPIACGHMLTMLSLGSVWRALHEPGHRIRWLLAASLAHGLAVGARASLLPGAAMLLVPAIQECRGRRPVGALLMAAAGPSMVIGAGLMLYNALRFGSPFELGMRYQLGPSRQDTVIWASLRYAWFNLRVYLLRVVHWNKWTPLLPEITRSPSPGYLNVERTFGILTSVPIVWMTSVLPLIWRRMAAPLRGFLVATAVLSGATLFTLCSVANAAMRYETEVLSPLILLSMCGVFGTERALAGRPNARRILRLVWGLLLVLSVAFNLLVATVNLAEAHCQAGNVLFDAGRTSEARGEYERALKMKPDFPEASAGLAGVYLALGRLPEAIAQGQRAVQLKPKLAEAHNRLGVALHQAGRLDEAIEQFAEATRIKPDYADAHLNLGFTLERAGRATEAIVHYEQALRLKPELTALRDHLVQLQSCP